MIIIKQIFFYLTLCWMTNPDNIESMQIQRASNSPHKSELRIILVIRARSNSWSSMLLPLSLDDDNQIYIWTYFRDIRQHKTF